MKSTNKPPKKKMLFIMLGLSAAVTQGAGLQKVGHVDARRNQTAQTLTREQPRKPKLAQSEQYPMSYQPLMYANSGVPLIT